MLVLASASKARHRLLTQAGIPHEVMPSRVVEDLDYKVDVKTLVNNLAKEKAMKIVKDIQNDFSYKKSLISINQVIGCDSLFEFQGEIFAKPKSREEAVNRLQRMSSSKGFLHTGHCFVYRPFIDIDKIDKDFTKVIEGVVSTKVEFLDIKSSEILDYVNTDEPLKCAGGFALEGKASLFIRSIDGCFSNVIGLSLPWLRDAICASNLNLK